MVLKLKKKEIDSYHSFQKGKFNGTSLDNKGRLTIGPKIKQLKGPENEYYLSLDIAKNGTIYVGTGHKASIYMVKPGDNSQENPIEEMFKSEDLDVYALLAIDNNTLFATTSPDGKVYKIKQNSKGNKTIVEFFNPEEKYIWDMKEDNANDIIIATGNGGAIYKLSKDGNAVKLFSAEDNHIISLYITKTNSILAGSGNRGILYRIDNMKVKILFDSPFEEIRGICEDKEGNIFFSATRGIRKPTFLNDNIEEKFSKIDSKIQTIKPIEKSILYCLRNDGIVENVWSSDTEYIYSICFDKKENNILVGTGNSGRVYRVDKDANFSIVYESDAAQIYKICATQGGFVFITNNTATISGIEDTLNSKGLYYSEIYDLGIQSSLGRIYWDALTSSNNTVSISVRTGNSNAPDSTWSKWSAPFTNGEDSNINVSNIRYFQVKAVLNSSNMSLSPQLNNLSVFYIQSNLSPKIKAIDIKRPESKKQSLDNKSMRSIDSKLSPKNLLNLNWISTDPNQDKLKYNLFLKKIMDINWIPFKENITSNKAVLDMELYEDGKYLLKIIADDSLANPTSISKSSSLISYPFLIDSTAPTVKDFLIKGSQITFSVEDKTSLISHVLFSFDSEIWYPVFPIDEIADSKSENYDFNLINKEGKKYIFLKVIDEYNNLKVFQKEF